MKASVSVPGKAILVGEHAAVYGHPALVCGVGLRLRANLEIVEDGAGRVLLDLPSLGLRQTPSWQEVTQEGDAAREAWERWNEGGGPLPNVGADAARVVRLALAEARRALRGAGAENADPAAQGRSLRLEVTSELPVGSGLGSSAAVAVAIAAATAAAGGLGTPPELIRAAAGSVERRQHGSPSGVDVAAVLEGGALLIEGGGGSELSYAPLLLDQRSSRGIRALRLYNSGSPAEGTGEVVAAVRQLRSADPERVARAFDQLDTVTRDLRARLGDGGSLAPLLQAAHRALIDLGVVPDAVRRQIARLEQAGFAAKISGAGGLAGPGAGLVLVWCPPGEEPDLDWQHIDAPLGAQGLEVLQ